MKKTIGIIGGMGPLATCDIFRKMVEAADVAKDQDHPRVLVDSNTRIPDRTAAILEGGQDPVPALIESAQGLQAQGADFLLMPCNTAHYFLPQVQEAVTVPFLHMPGETGAFLSRKGLKKVALLATTGTIRSGVYKKVLEEAGIQVLLPDEEGQQAIMALIYEGIKAGKKDIDTTPVQKTLEKLDSQGAQAMILGCTELPIAFNLFPCPYETVDPTQVAAVMAVHQAEVAVKQDLRERYLLP